MSENEKPPRGRPEPKGKSEGPLPANARLWLIPAILTLLLAVAVSAITRFNVRTITYSEFRDAVQRGEVVECRVSTEYVEGKIVRSAASAAAEAKDRDAGAKPAEGTAKAKPSPAPTPPTVKPAPASTEKDKDSAAKGEKSDGKPDEFFFFALRVPDDKLADVLLAAKVKFEGSSTSNLGFVFFNFILPVILFVAVGYYVMKRLGSASESALGFARNRARLVADKDTGVTFDDVAGCNEAKEDLQEVVEFLRSPDRYSALGAKIPKGVLLVGPPGTGKTLLARAVAGEAKAPFFSISGSDFVEMFVGVGAARVRDLFQQAKKHAPCIIFIDEIDAIGRQRGVHVGAVNDEREQTLNQLLVEMDGFETNAGVILLAATNRPDVLDRALLRPGRFDRQIVVDAPDFNGRMAILKVHAKDKKLAEGVDLTRVARGTPGFSGADLANAMNEAALLAVKRNHDLISQLDIEDAVEKVVAGPERKSRRITDEDKKLTAYHEVGHALVAHHCKDSDNVHKISIVPRGRALGYTLFLPDDDQFVVSRSQLLDKIRGLLGGRAAEDVVYGEINTGASSDLERATALAQRMLCVYGMGKAIGLVHCGRRENPFAVSDDTLQLDCSPETGREIDLELKKILDDAYADAKQILIDHRDQLDRVALELVRVEVLDAKQFEAVLAGESIAIPEPVASPPETGEAT